ncbi:MAG TPA: hypothetical protein VK191_09115 [Symbiobacteriaceae bacterium]|nr:hypothetical protein [Symbiobacteriaceae bacterium]
MIRFFWTLALIWLALTVYWVFHGAPRQMVGQTLLMVGVNGAAAWTLQWLQDRRSKR